MKTTELRKIILSPEKDEAEGVKYWACLTILDTTRSSGDEIRAIECATLEQAQKEALDIIEHGWDGPANVSIDEGVSDGMRSSRCFMEFTNGSPHTHAIGERVGHWDTREAMDKQSWAGPGWYYRQGNEASARHDGPYESEWECIMECLEAADRGEFSE